MYVLLSPHVALHAPHMLIEKKNLIWEQESEIIIVNLSSLGLQQQHF